MADGQKRGACIFCGGFGLSKEHLFADWMRDYLPETASTHLVANDDLVAKPGKLHRPGAVRSRRLRVVCEKCNNEWMSDLQGDAKPILIPIMRGMWRKLGQNEERILGAWATMFTMILEQGRSDIRISTQEQREFLMANQTAPKHWHVWIALLSSPHCTFAQGAFGEEERTPIAGGFSQRTKAQETVIVAAHAVFHTISFTERSLETRNIGPLRVNARSGGFRQLWPTRISEQTPSSLALVDVRRHRARVWKQLTGRWPL